MASSQTLVDISPSATPLPQLMVEGDKWEMYIPSELGYGDRGSPPKIGGGDVLVFTMEILKINGESVRAAPRGAAARARPGSPRRTA